VPQGADQAVKGHWGDVAHDRTPGETKATVGGEEGLPGHVRPHAAVTQDKMGQDGEDGFACGTLNPPDRETTEADTRIMRMTRQASTTAGTGRLMGELEAKSEEKGPHELNERVAIAQQEQVCGFILEIDGNRTVCSCRFGGVAHVLPLWYRVANVIRHEAGKA